MVTTDGNATNAEASKELLELLGKAVVDPHEVRAFLKASEELLPTVLANFEKAEFALDGIGEIVGSPYAWDNPSSALESIGNRVEETGRDVWSGHE